MKPHFPIFLATVALSATLVAACGSGEPVPFAGSGFSSPSVLPPCTYLCATTGTTAGSTTGSTSGTSGSTGTHK